MRPFSVLFALTTLASASAAFAEVDCGKALRDSPLGPSILFKGTNTVLGNTPQKVFRAKTLGVGRVTVDRSGCFSTAVADLEAPAGSLDVFFCVDESGRVPIFSVRPTPSKETEAPFLAAKLKKEMEMEPKEVFGLKGTIAKSPPGYRRVDGKLYRVTREASGRYLEVDCYDGSNLGRFSTAARVFVEHQAKLHGTSGDAYFKQTNSVMNEVLTLVEPKTPAVEKVSDSTSFKTVPVGSPNPPDSTQRKPALNTKTVD